MSKKITGQIEIDLEQVDALGFTSLVLESIDIDDLATRVVESIDIEELVSDAIDTDVLADDVLTSISYRDLWDNMSEYVDFNIELENEVEDLANRYVPERVTCPTISAVNDALSRGVLFLLKESIVKDHIQEMIDASINKAMGTQNVFVYPAYDGMTTDGESPKFSQSDVELAIRKSLEVSLNTTRDEVIDIYYTLAVESLPVDVKSKIK
jgi:hypothetical protein